MEGLFTVESGIALVALASLEIVLGIDNVVFISILSGKLPEHQQALGRRIGLMAAMIMRIALLLVIGWVMGLTAPLFALGWEGLFHHEFSGRDLILLGGGLFLIAKATYEIHEKLEAGPHEGPAGPKRATLLSVVTQVMMLDLVFSLDSVITAVGMTDQVPVMIAAIVIAVGVMMLSAEGVSSFVERHPTMKMLALSFLLLIGVMLTAEGFHAHIPKGYIYFAMAFSLVIELLNMRVRKVHRPVHLQEKYVKQQQKLAELQEAGPGG